MKSLAEQIFGPGATGDYRWRGIDHAIAGEDITAGAMIGVTEMKDRSDFPDIDQMLEDLRPTTAQRRAWLISTFSSARKSFRRHD